MSSSAVRFATPVPLPSTVSTRVEDQAGVALQGIDQIRQQAFDGKEPHGIPTHLQSGCRRTREIAWERLVFLAASVKQDRHLAFLEHLTFTGSLIHRSVKV